MFRSYSFQYCYSSDFAYFLFLWSLFSSMVEQSSSGKNPASLTKCYIFQERKGSVILLCHSDMNLHKLFHLSVSFLSVKGLDTCLLLIPSLLQGVLDIPWALWEVKHAVRAEATELSAAPLHACLLNTAISCKAHAHCKPPDAQLCSEHHCCCQMLVWQ